MLSPVLDFYAGQMASLPSQSFGALFSTSKGKAIFCQVATGSPTEERATLETPAGPIQGYLDKLHALADVGDEILVYRRNQYPDGNPDGTFRIQATPFDAGTWVLGPASDQVGAFRPKEALHNLKVKAAEGLEKLTKLRLLRTTRIHHLREAIRTYKGKRGDKKLEKLKAKLVELSFGIGPTNPQFAFWFKKAMEGKMSRDAIEADFGALDGAFGLTPSQEARLRDLLASSGGGPLSDDRVHTLAREFRMQPDELEAIIYSYASRWVRSQGGFGDGLTKEQVDAYWKELEAAPAEEEQAAQQAATWEWRIKDYMQRNPGVSAEKARRELEHKDERLLKTMSAELDKRVRKGEAIEFGTGGNAHEVWTQDDEEELDGLLAGFAS